MSKYTEILKTHIENRDLVIERIFNAPRELVFKAFSDPKLLAKWWGPQGWQTQIHEFEFKPDGVWLYCMKCMDENQGAFFGQESWGKAFYHEIIEPEKIVYTDTFVDAEGKELEGMPNIEITMLFIEHEGKTKVITRNQFATEETLKQIVEMGVTQGVASQYIRLDELLAELQ